MRRRFVQESLRIREVVEFIEDDQARECRVVRMGLHEQNRDRHRARPE